MPNDRTTRTSPTIVVTGATGNVGTEDVLYMLNKMGIETGVDLGKVRAASRFIATVVDHALTSKAYQAMEAASASA